MDSSIRVDGAVTFWSLNEWTNRRTLADGLESLGFGKYAPGPRTHEACLLDAIGEIFPKRLGFRTEHLEQRSAWEIREIHRGAQENTYVLKHVVHLREENGSPKILVGPFSPDLGTKLASKFNDFLGLARAAQVTMGLNAILAELGGVSLRPRGAVYWLPGHQLDKWDQVKAVVERAGIQAGNKVYKIGHQLDADALRAVRDAIVAEVQSEAKRIEEEVHSGELGQRALRGRRDEAAALHEKVELYEDLLRTPLASLRETAEKAETAAVMAGMMAAV